MQSNTRFKTRSDAAPSWRGGNGFGGGFVHRESNRRGAGAAPGGGAYDAAVPREPFTRDQLAFIEARALDALRVWGRALKHLNRIGAGGHELARVIRAAHDAEHALRVHAMYAKHEAEKRSR